MAFGIDDIGLMIGAQVLGGMMQSDAAGDAARIQSGATDRATAATADATNRSTAEIRRQYDLTRQDNAPFREGGMSAMERLRAFMGLGDTPQAAALQAPAVSAAPLRSRDDLYSDAISRAPLKKGALSIFRNAPGTPDVEWANQEADRMFAEQQARAQAHAPAPVAAAPAVPFDPNQPFGTSPLMSKFTLDDFWQDPVTKASYQAGLDLGTKALRNAAPLTTGLDSGAAMKELLKFGTDYTGGQAVGSQSRFEGNKTNVFNRLMAMIGGGQTANSVDANAGASAAGGIAGATMNGANSIAGLISGQGNAAGAARLAGANAWGGAMNNISNWWNQNTMLDKVMKSRSPSYTGYGMQGDYQYG